MKFKIIRPNGDVVEEVDEIDLESASEDNAEVKTDNNVEKKEIKEDSEEPDDIAL
jgi:hypothetical protein